MKIIKQTTIKGVKVGEDTPLEGILNEGKTYRDLEKSIREETSKLIKSQPRGNYPKRRF